MKIYEVGIEILETHTIHAENEAQAESLAQKKCAWNRGPRAQAQARANARERENQRIMEIPKTS